MPLACQRSLKRGKAPGLWQEVGRCCKPAFLIPESSFRLPQRRPHEANLTEGMSNVVAHTTTAYPQALLAVDLSPFPLLAIGLAGSHRALSQLLAPL
jgi:hypothetical protein